MLPVEIDQAPLRAYLHQRNVLVPSLPGNLTPINQAQFSLLVNSALSEANLQAYKALIEKLTLKGYSPALFALTEESF